MPSLWLPEPLYRSLPFVYAAAGAGLLALVHDNPIAAMSALLLIAAGGLIAVWRFRHREVVSTAEAARRSFHQRKRKAAETGFDTF